MALGQTQPAALKAGLIKDLQVFDLNPCWSITFANGTWLEFPQAQQHFSRLKLWMKTMNMETLHHRFFSCNISTEFKIFKNILKSSRVHILISVNLIFRIKEPMIHNFIQMCFWNSSLQITFFLIELPQSLL